MEDLVEAGDAAIPALNTPGPQPIDDQEMVEGVVDGAEEGPSVFPVGVLGKPLYGVIKPLVDPAAEAGHQRELIHQAPRIYDDVASTRILTNFASFVRSKTARGRSGRYETLPRVLQRYHYAENLLGWALACRISKP